MQPCMLLIRKMTEECFEWNLDNVPDDRLESILTIPEGDIEDGFCIGQTALECNLSV